jgi:antitoxin (DNA-binding transcriptional repressor) of toxin-antitoxin stability system
VTKRGRPVAKLIPIQRGGGALLGSLKGKIQVKGDIFSTGIEWKANAEP